LGRSAEEFSNKIEVVKTTNKEVKTESVLGECVRISLDRAKFYGEQHLAYRMEVETKELDSMKA
jgi:hypothetical protein